jgi:hypothetical protein
MKMPLISGLLFLALGQLPMPSAPHAELSTSEIQASFYLPDPQSGYYRGTRFDWAGQIHSLRWKKHEYFGQWFDKYDPKLHDAIEGPVEEFLTNMGSLGYTEAKVGETFVRIGVGTVRKTDDKDYQRFNTYEIVDPGVWKHAKGKDWIEFVHELKDSGTGYSYVYRKKLTFAKNTLVIEHDLKNTGRKRIDTSVYNHNFFTLDNQTTGPDFVVRFPYELKAQKPLNSELADVRGKEIIFNKVFERGQTVYTEFEGFGPTPASYDIRIENRKTGAAVHITGDRPIQKQVFWSAWKTVCPEPYIDVSADAGKSSTWRLTYEFYEATQVSQGR